MAADGRSILEQAQRRATALMEELLRHQTDLSAPRAPVGVESLQAGREALREAVDSATRLLQSIEPALAQGRSSQESEQ